MQMRRSLLRARTRNSPGTVVFPTLGGAAEMAVPEPAIDLWGIVTP